MLLSHFSSFWMWALLLRQRLSLHRFRRLHRSLGYRAQQCSSIIIWLWFGTGYQSCDKTRAFRASWPTLHQQRMSIICDSLYRCYQMLRAVHPHVCESETLISMLAWWEAGKRRGDGAVLAQLNSRLSLVELAHQLFYLFAARQSDILR